MFACQQSLITHLQTGFTTPTVKTLEEYAGHLKDAKIKTMPLPSILPFFISSQPADQEKTHRFDLLIITQSRMLEKREQTLFLETVLIQHVPGNTLFSLKDFLKSTALV